MPKNPEPPASQHSSEPSAPTVPVQQPSIVTPATPSALAESKTISVIVLERFAVSADLILVPSSQPQLMPASLFDEAESLGLVREA